MKYGQGERSAFCRCGAQWHGRYVHSPYRQRHHTQCGAPISREQFMALGFRVKRLQHWKNVERWAAADPSPAQEER